MNENENDSSIGTETLAKRQEFGEKASEHLNHFQWTFSISKCTFVKSGENLPRSFAAFIRIEDLGLELVLRAKVWV